MEKTPVSVGCIILNEDRRLLIVSKRHSDAEISWSVPKGEREGKEKDLDTAFREVEEEAGIPKSRLLIKNLILADFETYKRVSGGGFDKSRPKRIRWYPAFSDMEKVGSKDRRKHPEAKWIQPHRFDKYIEDPRAQKAFEEYVVESMKDLHEEMQELFHAEMARHSKDRRRSKVSA